MLAKEELNKLYFQLLQEAPVDLSIGGSQVHIQLMDDSSRLSLSTVVYSGGNFIPKSVRASLSNKIPPFALGHIETHFTVNEESFSISLNYLGRLDSIYSPKLHYLLEEFTWLAEEWRNHLDEHDKNDLVHIYVK